MYGVIGVEARPVNCYTRVRGAFVWWLGVGAGMGKQMNLCEWYWGVCFVEAGCGVRVQRKGGSQVALTRTASPRTHPTPKKEPLPFLPPVVNSTIYANRPEPGWSWNPYSQRWSYFWASDVGACLLDFCFNTLLLNAGCLQTSCLPSERAWQQRRVVVLGE